MAEALVRFHGGGEEEIRPPTAEEHDRLMEKYA